MGEDSDFDPIVVRGPHLERVQVKHVRSDGRVIKARCYSVSVTNGKVRATKHYTSMTIDWLAVYDATTGTVVYIPAAELGDGRRSVSIRLQPPSYNRRADIRSVADYARLPPLP